MIKRAFFPLALCMMTVAMAEIRILLTAALLDNEFELRKGHYIKSLDILKKYGYANPYIVDSIKPKGPTFLDDYSANVLYSHVNDATLLNKGVNEAASLIAALNHFNFNEEDLIVKMTGRYYFASRNFLTAVEQNPEVDAFVHLEKNGNVRTSCIALRGKYFKEFLQGLTLATMEKELVCIETAMSNYLIRACAEHGMRVHYFDTLHIAANVWGWGNNHYFQYQ
jgi:hypothetical protein